MLNTPLMPIQDAVEYFQHLLEVMARSERASGGRLGDNVPDLAPTSAAFQFAVEDRVRCAESGRVSYRRTPSNVLALDIDPAAATNSGELEEYQVGNHALVHHRQDIFRAMLRQLLLDYLRHESQLPRPQDDINHG